MSLQVTKLEPIISMFKLNQLYRTFSTEVDWLVSSVNGTERTGGHRYTGPLIDVMKQIELDYEVGLLSDLDFETAPDRLNDLISNNGNIIQFIIFDLQHNRQLM